MWTAWTRLSTCGCCSQYDWIRLLASSGQRCFCYNYHGLRSSIAEGIRPVAQPLVVGYASNVGVPLRGSNLPMLTIR